MAEPCLIIGVLDDGERSLSSQCLDSIARAEVVIGATRTLSLFKHVFNKNVTTHDLSGSLARVPEWVRAAQENDRRVVVLATGDPLCHGIGSYLIKKLGEERCTVLPNLSLLQLACARLGLAWQGIRICSVHSRDAGEWQAGAGPEHGFHSLLQALREHDLVAVYTSPENTPDRIARMLQRAGLAEEFELSVAACLLREEEAIFPRLPVAEAADRRFADPNLVILQRRRARQGGILFGRDDGSFAQRKPDKGLITKLEVRAVSLARLQLREDSLVWDIGAGSGAVGLEAAKLCARGFVYAMEKNEADIALIEENRRRMGLSNYRIEAGKAPAGLDGWPDPDAVFIGGSGGGLAALIEGCLARLRPGGRLVMNFVTLENLAEATGVLKRAGADWDVTQLQASRSRPILHMHRLQAENPVWIVAAQKPDRETREHE